jgi:translocation and assembly module TamA
VKDFGKLIFSRLTLFLVSSAALCAVYAGASAQVELVWQEAVSDDAVRAAIQDDVAASSSYRTPLQARREARRTGERLQDRLNSLGYLDPDIETGIATESDLKAFVRVDPGKRFTVSAAGIDYAETDMVPDMGAFAEKLAALEGQPVIAEAVISLEREIVTDLKAAGYAYVEAAPRNILGDRSAGTVEITYNIALGPKVVFGEVQFSGDIRTKTSYLERLIPFSTGDTYSPDKLALFNGRLDDTRMFSKSSARLSDEGRATDTETTEIRDVIVLLEERPRNTIGLGASFSTAEGPGLTADYVRRNLIGRGDLLEAELTIAQLDRSLDVTWRRPNEFGYGRGLVLTAGLSDETTDAFESRSVSLGAGYEVVEGPDFSWSYGGTVELVRETSEQIERDLQLATIYASARVDRSNDLLNPTRGWRAELRVSPHQSFGDSEVQFLRTVGQARYYIPATDTLTLAARVRLGAAIGADLEDLPSDDRFYAGGGGSVRGYSYQAIGPRSIDNEPLGGRALFDSSLELRWQRSTRLGFVTFIDAGSVSSKEQPSFDDLRYGAGIGARYATPAGPLRFDIAVPIDRSEFDDPVQFYVSIGQAF